MRIFHLAERSDWDAARAGRYYDRSTRGRSLAEVGFVHCSHAHQWQRVRDAVYDDVTEPLLLLTIDTDLLDAPVVEEPGDPGSTERFPHVYGAIPLDAVVAVTELPAPSSGPRDDPAGGRSFSSLLMAEIGVRIVLAFGVMVVSALAGTLVQEAVGEPWGLLAAVVGFVVATAVAVVVYRRRERRGR